MERELGSRGGEETAGEGQGNKPGGYAIIREEVLSS